MSEPTLQDRFHPIGIGGAGVSIVAELLASRGATVEGSDREESAALEHLRPVGVRAFVGHEASHVDPSSVVAASTAIHEDNPELVITHECGQCVIHRSQALVLAASDVRFVGVAGMHEKTTTSGMFVIGLSVCRRDPSVAVGSVLPQLGTGAHLGGGDAFIVEADELGGSSLNYTPAIETVTDVEPDRPDRYHSHEEFKGTSVEFVRCVVPGGLLVTCAEDEGAIRPVQSTHAEGLRVVTYGRRERPLCISDVVTTDVRVETQEAGVSLMWDELSALLVLSAPGEHNTLNAAVAWAAGIECGLSPQVIADGLGEFTGAARRLEARGQVGSRHLLNDYAHHPTEVEVVIREAHVVAGEGDVIVVFQPHLYPRTCISAECFVQALSGTDHVALAGTYGAREDSEPGTDSSLISSRIESAFYVEDMHEAAHLAASLTPEGSVCLTMGAGSITRCVSDVLDEWKRMET